MSKSTQYGTSYTVSDLTQNGYTAGTLTGLSINDEGVITTRYSNGQSQATGQLALAIFRNTQGLKPVGQGNWEETPTSGQPIPGSPKQGNFGSINSGALEASNVDLTAELVAMMTAQRDYQANAQTIKTQDTVLQTLVNLR
jgi:flagellar hook protein FlgE